MNIANEVFKEHKKQIIAVLGRKAVSDDQLTELGKNMLNKKYLGTFAQDKYPMNKNGFAIVNVDIASKINTDMAHWVAIYSTKTRLYIYDSYGRTTKFVLPIIYEKARKHNKKIYESYHDAEQHGIRSEICGQLSMAWIFTANTIGIRKELLV